MGFRPPSAASGSGLPSWTAVKTGAYTAAAGEFVPADATSTSFSVTLPAGTANQLAGVKKIDTSANAVGVTVAAGGTIDGDAQGVSITAPFGAIFGCVSPGAWRIVAVTSAGSSTGGGLPPGWTGDAHGHVVATTDDVTNHLLMLDLGSGGFPRAGAVPPMNIRGGPTQREFFTVHETGGVCITTVTEPNWGTIHAYPFVGQTKPLLILTEDVHDANDNRHLFMVDRNGCIYSSPQDLANASDTLLQVLNASGKVQFEVRNGGEILGAPSVINISTVANPVQRSTNGTWNSYTNTSDYFRFREFVYEGTVGEWIEYDVGCAAGSYYLDTYLNGRNDQGRATVAIDAGTAGAVAVGTVDAYQASSTGVDVVVTLGPFTIPAAGRHRLRYTVTTKNASSSGAFVPLRHAQLRRV